MKINSLNHNLLPNQRVLSVSKETLEYWKVLFECWYEFHLYHVQRVQFTTDYAPRIDFCRTMLAINRENPQFLNKIFWTNETTFKKDSYLNLHNLHSWHIENPHLMREDRSQYQFKVNMWTRILNWQICGPFELPENLNGEFIILQINLPNLFEDVPQHLPGYVVSTRWLPSALS